MNISDLCEIYSTNNPHQAEVIKDALQSEGIQAQITGANLWAAVGDLPAAAIAMKIMVHAPDKVQARQIALQYDGLNAKNTGPDWTCATCKETNAASFEVCWKCQSEHQPA